MDKKEATLQMLVEAIYDTIKGSDEMGLGGIPSGHLYAMVMDMISLNLYQDIIDILVRVGKIKETNYLLTAI